jgi:hypothetical protein
MNDPQKLWQSQPTEPIKMSLDDIRRKVKTFQSKQRLAAISWMVIAPIMCAFFARTLLNTPGVISRVGLGIVCCWTLYGAFQAYRYLWPRPLADDATYQTSLDFYRAELNKKQNYARNIWQKMGLTWLFVGIALFLGPPLSGAFQNPGLLRNALPFFVLLTAWFVMFFVLRKRERQKLQLELDDLDRTA